MESKDRPPVLLSCSPEDRKAQTVLLLMRSLECASSCWWWRDTLEPGGDDMAAMSTAVDSCSAVVAILSTGSCADPYCRMEWDLAEAREIREMRPCLFLARIADTPVPASLQHRDVVDLAEDPNPGIRQVVNAVLPDPPGEVVTFPVVTGSSGSNALHLAAVATTEMGHLSVGMDERESFTQAANMDALRGCCHRLGYDVVFHMSVAGTLTELVGVEESESGTRHLLEVRSEDPPTARAVREVFLPREVPSALVPAGATLVHFSTDSRHLFTRVQWTLAASQYAEFLSWLRSVENTAKVVPYLLATARRELKASRVQLAALLGVPPATLLGWERGTDPPPPSLEADVVALLKKKSVVRRVARSADRRRRGGVRVYKDELEPVDVLFKYFGDHPAVGWLWLLLFGLGVAGAIQGWWGRVAALAGSVGLAFIVDKLVPRCSECGARVLGHRDRCARCQIRLRS